MLTYEQCLSLATAKLKEASGNNPEYIIWEEKTIVKEYGWIFMPATRDYIATGNIMSLSPGISSIVVNKVDSMCIMAPSSVPFQTFIQDYENKLKK